MTTPLYPTFRKRVHDALEELIKQQVTPWSFLTTGHPFRINRFNGREIAYEGAGFDGSPRHVFWSRYIEPFLEDICVSEIECAVSMATEREVDGRLLLRELQDLLSAGCLRVYKHMADVDRRLRGKGFPKKVSLRPIEREVEQMDRFIGERINSELAMWRQKPRYEIWFARNKFLVWAIGVLLVFAGIAVGLLPGA